MPDITVPVKRIYGVLADHAGHLDESKSRIRIDSAANGRANFKLFSRQTSSSLRVSDRPFFEALGIGLDRNRSTDDYTGIFVKVPSLKSLSGHVGEGLLPPSPKLGRRGWG
jgi:hypothetical protein